jgi:hypothetical protein
VAALCLLAAHAGAEPSDAVTRDAARSLGVSGVEAFQSGSYDVAANRLEKAYALMRVPAIGLWSARSLVKLGRLVEALNRYTEVVAQTVSEGDVAVQRDAQRDAKAELEALRPRVPHLTVIVEGAGPPELTLRIDGQPVPAQAIGAPGLLDPGPHRIDAEAGGVLKSSSVVLEVGQSSSVTLDLRPAERARGATAPATPPAPPPPAPAPASGGSSRATLGWIGVGVGGAGIGLGAVVGVLALGKRSDLKDSGACTGGVCSPDKRSEVQSLDTLRMVSSVGFIAGGVIAAGGLVLLFTAPSGDAVVKASLGPGSATLAGTF